MGQDRLGTAPTDLPDPPPTEEGVRRRHVTPGPSSVHTHSDQRGPGPTRAITTAGALQDDRRHPRGTKDEIQDKQRRAPPSHSVLPTVFDHCTRDSGENDDFRAPTLMYAAPSL